MSLNTWKCYFTLLAAVLFAPRLLAQVAPPAAYSTRTQVNYVREWDAKAPIQDSATLVNGPITSVGRTTQYFDGLGRPLQTVGWQVSPSGKDMVTPIVYDAFGREPYKYLPFVANAAQTGDVVNDGNFKLDPFQQQAAFLQVQYPGENYYYSQTNYEASPLNRPLETLAPGNNWVGGNRGVSTQYLVNEATDSVQIWNIAMAAGSIPTSAGSYAAGQLYKNVTTDEQNNQVVEYKDIEGHEVLKKVQLSASPGTGHVGWLCTYYVYDDLDNLRFVLQPRVVELINGSWAISQAIANELCFRYEYDQRKRMIIKKVPGAGELWMVYDARDRLVMSQDSLLGTLSKWQVTEYDSLDRPWRTGLLMDGNNRAYHQNLAYNSITYPNTGGGNYEVLTQTYYDNYSWVSGATSALSAAMATNNTTNSNYFITGYNSSPTYAVPVTAVTTTQGMVTGNMTKVIGTTSQYLYAVSFYDDHSRVIQTQSVNYTGGVDTVTTQYDFTGKPLRTLLGHHKSGNTAQGHSTLTKMSYDASFRLKSIFRNIDGATADHLVDSMQYDELGQLQTKYLGSNMENLAYAYNIRGWLTGINKGYVGGTANHYFGMELAYDTSGSIIGSTTYLNPAYNGNIAGTMWKSAGDGVARKYDFSYDNVNRLTGAAYQDNKNGSWGTTAMDFSVGNLTYDANGNIMTMNQKGFKIGSPASLIDQLVYTYQTASNKLSQVFDSVNDQHSTLGDFHYNPSTKDSVDYSYDVNGNLSTDNNKAIDHITYNYLNLPQQVHMNGKGNILYTYDAAGNKLAKLTMDSLSGHSTTTLYLGSFVYQQSDTITSPGGGADTLQFISHEEGRTRYINKINQVSGQPFAGLIYDYFLKDHLGNTRTVLTEEQDTTIYAATMEQKNAAVEDQLFNNVSTTQYITPNGFEPSSGGDTSNHFVSALNGTAGDNRVGPSIVLKVMARDTVSANVYGWYQGAVQPPPSNELPLVNDLLSVLSGDVVGASAGHLVGSLSPVTSVLGVALPSFLSVKDADDMTTQPKAFLNWVLFDDQLNYVTGGVTQVPAISGTMSKQLMQGNIPVVSKNGYLYIYVSNESQQYVFFDNLNIQYRRGPLLEETHYYPFGLTMAGISDKALKTNYAENKYRYNKGTELQNKEFSDGRGLELYTTEFRPYDPQIGRFTQIDELSQLDYSYSPYAFATDNPILFNDPTGLAISDSSHPQVLQEAVVTAKKPLDTKNGQVYPAQSPFWDAWEGHRSYPGHQYIGKFAFRVNYEVNAKGYLTGRLSPNLLAFNAPIGDKPLNLKAVFNIKNFIKGRYVVYRGVKDGLDYIGKAKGGIEFRYSLAEIGDMEIAVVKGLENIPDNATALGVEQLMIDLNGGAGTGELANKIPATVKEIYIDNGRYWLDSNMPGWEQSLKFK